MKHLRILLVLLSYLTLIYPLEGEVLFISDKSKPIAEVNEPGVKTKGKDLDKYFSTKKLGSFVEHGKTYFRLFSPDAGKVTLVTFHKPEDTTGSEYEMKRDNEGVWETSIEGEHYGLFYGYKVFNPKYPKTKNVICIDPYTKAVASYNTYFTPRRSIVVKEGNYNWEGDHWIQRDWRDLIIYEMHIRDMTADPSAGSDKPGTYQGLIEHGKTGGIDYIKKLGVNTVELLPSQEFANIEIPFKDSLNGRYNTWNPYERNHWGYMTAAFFAPEAYYSDTSKNLEWNTWSGTSGRQINDFKDMVKDFHKDGIGVIMDVVYNHLSEYELGNLKEIDKDYYFRLDKNGNFIDQSYCGNDLKTERPMVRRLILDSILYWMKEYHVDGFRFDLGKLIDWKTVEEIIYEAKKINPHVVIVCEPWGGGYDPAGFSLRGWGSWNDQIRNGIKGENPLNGLGWIFGKWYGNNNPGRIKSYVNGTLVRDKFGLFQKKEHSVNYLASHDGYMLGDFIRIATKSANPNEIIKNVDSFVKLTPLELKLNKLAALFLFTSQGITMIQEGDEFARTKVIPYNEDVPDTNKGKMDNNSYNKDNSTNYINYRHAEINSDLVNYYKGLISLREKFAAFRRAKYENVRFFNITDNPFALEYNVKYENENFIVLFNSNHNKDEEFILPEGKWEVYVNPETAGASSLGEVSGKIVLQPTTGFVLKKK
ncbi:MAG: alpha-amylase family glycosyl hydrolase [Ignavibacteriaceae bacterium]